MKRPYGKGIEQIGKEKGRLVFDWGKRDGSGPQGERLKAPAGRRRVPRRGMNPERRKGTQVRHS